jgi:hypothetical protein
VTTVGLIQSNYIPWKGYFDIIHDVDLFVFHDDLQYTKGDWRNRNVLKTPEGERWLTIPVGTSEHRRICDVPLPASDWAREHWRRIESAYREAPYFALYRDYFARFYLESSWRSLSEINQALIVGISHDLLGITTEFADSRTFHPTRCKGERVLEILESTRAAVYVSGPSARNYITDEQLARAGVEVVWKDYSGYPVYEQLHPPFSHRVTILDLLFHTGPQAAWHIWGWRGSKLREVA